MNILNSIELREDNVDEVLQFLGIGVDNFGWYGIGIDPADGKFKFSDYAGATVSVNIGDHIGRLEHEKGFTLLGFVPEIAPDLIHDSNSWRETLLGNQEYYKNALNDLVALCAGLAKEAGWDEKQREMGTKLMLIVSEVSEAMEGDRKGLMDDHLPHIPMVEVECVDATVRILHLAGEQKMNFGSTFVQKLIYNINRPDHKLENRSKENGKKY